MIRRVQTDDGSVTLEDTERGVTYRSTGGARTESLHVFVNGCGIGELLNWRVVELGFGGGMNFEQTYLRARELGLRLDYVSVERSPVAESALPINDEGALELARQTLATGEGASDAVCSLHVIHADWRDLVDRSLGVADAIYHDPFGPSDDPDSWTADCFRWQARHARPGTKLGTYSVAGHVRRALADAGWNVSRRPGCGHKREVLLADWPG